MWFALFALTPGLLADGPGALLSRDVDLRLAAETVLVVVLAVALMCAFRRESRILFARGRTMWALALPAAALVALPFHYALPRPLLLYVVWMAASVLWQDYLTFGLLQSSVRRILPAWGSVLAVGALFMCAHLVYLPDRFFSPLPALAMLALGIVLALLRSWTGTLHVVLALHLSFYYLFA